MPSAISILNLHFCFKVLVAKNIRFLTPFHSYSQQVRYHLVLNIFQVARYIFKILERHRLHLFSLRYVKYVI